MAKRLFDIVFSLIALIFLLPVFLFAAIGIKLGSKGPVFYKANRMGKDKIPFKMYKFRSMHISNGVGSAITAANDDRVFGFGNLLRKTKIDELPQLINVLLGQMSIVGPRPEDVSIVERYYTEEQLETLKVAPGLASPGSLFNYTHGNRYLDVENVEQAYIEGLMPIKLNLEQYYVKNYSFLYDLQIIFRTIAIIVMITLGKESFDYPKEFYNKSSELLSAKNINL